MRNAQGMGGTALADLPQAETSGGYGRFCPNLQRLGSYVDGLDLASPNVVDNDVVKGLFCASAQTAYDAQHEGRHAGMLAIVGDPEHLLAAVGGTLMDVESPELAGLLGRYGSRGILLDPDKAIGVLGGISRISDYDGAVLFDPLGDIFALGQYIVGVTRAGVSENEFALARRYKRNNHPGTTATRHLTALWVTGALPVEAVVTSDEANTTQTMRQARIVRELAYDPNTGFGESSFRHLTLAVPGTDREGDMGRVITEV